LGFLWKDTEIAVFDIGLPVAVIIYKMASKPGLQVLWLKGHIFSFCPRYSTIFNNKITLSFGLPGIRFGSSNRKRSNHFGPRFRGEYEVYSARVSDIDYNRFRENSQRLRKLINDYFSRASQAYSRGQGRLANILSKRGRMMNFAAKHSERESSARILEMVNAEYRSGTPSCPRTLNVHGLHVREAVDAVKEFLEYNSDCKGRLKIITGWGKNSYPREVRLLPALKTLLEEDGRHFEEVRPGVVEIIM
jgi:DNA-nicking Smr family endonuclease